MATDETEDAAAPVVQVAANAAKANFYTLLDQVERGEVVEMTRHRVAVARLVPAGPGPSRRAGRDAVRTLAAMRDGLAARGVRMSQADIRQLREEVP